MSDIIEPHVDDSLDSEDHSAIKTTKFGSYNTFKKSNTIAKPKASFLEQNEGMVLTMLQVSE